MTEVEKWLQEKQVKKLTNLWGRPAYNDLLITSTEAKGVKPIKDFREECIEKYGFVLWTEEAVKSLLPHGPFLDLGCGSGYLAYELKCREADAIAIDPEPHRNVRTKPTISWIDVEPITAEQALNLYKNRTVIMSWPSYEDSWVSEALSLITSDAKFSKLVYVGEGEGGCTGNNEFHCILDKSWGQVEEIDIPMWHGIHDYLVVYQKK